MGVTNANDDESRYVCRRMSNFSNRRSAMKPGQYARIAPLASPSVNTTRPAHCSGRTRRDTVSGRPELTLVLPKERILSLGQRAQLPFWED